MNRAEHGVVVIGAGIGGLAAALSLAAHDIGVTVFESRASAGGKIRTVPTALGPADCGPTVLTLRPHFEALFAELGERLDDHLDLIAEPLLARHFWPDGSMLDLYADREASAAAVHDFAGPRAADEFRRFCQRAEALLAAFEQPVMQAARISPRAVANAALAGGGAVLPALLPFRSMGGMLAREFSDPRLAQLFGRYATYVGGVPGLSPPLLRLIWAAEERGVWRVRGGMAALAAALHRLAVSRGVAFHFETPAARIEVQGGRVRGIVTRAGARHAADAVVFNGDPAALFTGMLGPGAENAVKTSAILPRALSAVVWSGAGTASGLPLAHHNVFFGTDAASEFGPLTASGFPADPTLYICAQDRGAGSLPNGSERFEIIMNAPPTTYGPAARQEEDAPWQERILGWLAERGLDLTPESGSVSTPQVFARDFPGSAGSLYGRSPHGIRASFLRPTARSRLRGLYLAGGGVHPGPGVPMALLSGRHAAAAIVSDRISTSSSRRAAMPGGMSTGSPTTGSARSR